MVDRITSKTVPHYRRVRNENHQIDTDRINSQEEELELEGFISRMKHNLSPFNREKHYQNKPALVDDSSYLSLSELLSTPEDDFLNGPNTGDGGVVRSVREWDVKIPPVGKKIVAGKLVPTMKMLGTRWMKRPRRLSIEIYSKLSQTAIKEGREEEESIAGGSVKAANRHVMKGLLRGESFADHENEELRDGEIVYVRVLKPFIGEQDSDCTSGDNSNDNDDSDDDNDDNNSGTNVEDAFSVSTLGDCCGAEEHFDQRKWKEHHRYSIDAFEIVKVHRNTMEVKTGVGHAIEIQTIVFKSAKELLSFQKVVGNLANLERRKARRQLDNYKRNAPPRVLEIIQEDEKKDESNFIKLLVEICSATNLPPVGKTSDPYCKVYMGPREIHKTKHIPNTLDPIWTVSTGCFLLISKAPEDFFGTTRGINFVLKHHDIGTKHILGRLKILPKDMIEAATGERFEYDLVVNRSPQNHDQARSKPKLALRIRHATKHDLEFMKFLGSDKNARREIRSSGQSGFVPPKVHEVHILSKNKKRNENGQFLYRVKPGPDPKRAEETQWLTSDQISAECLQPSHNWIAAGSGRLGKLHFEIIRCDGLPNKDSKFPGDKTDAFATIVFEDSVVNSEVINNSLSPRFMPWTQRAFVFNIAHPSSQLFVGVSDFDSENRAISHDPIGRVAIDLANIKANTNYLLHYDLHQSTVVKRRQNQGKITIRIRIEWNSERDAILAVLKSPALDQQFINVEKSSDFLTAHHACHGRDNVDDFDLNILASYIQELQEYKNVQYYVDIKRIALHIILWRGHYPITIRDLLLRRKTILIPLHSIFLFVACTSVVENYNYLPSFFLFTIAWLFLAMVEFRKKHPSPWSTSKTYFDFFHSMITNNSAAQTIEVNENIREVEEYNQEISRKHEEREKDAIRMEKQRKAERKHLEELAMKGNSSLDTTRTINPLKPILFPAQQNLAVALVALRKIRAVLVWDKSYEAFWITTLCIGLGVVFLFVPWDFLIYWVLKIAIWTFLGPWMKLVDIFYFRKLENMPKKERYKGIRKNWKKRWNIRLKEATETRIENENAVKLQDFKKVIFGRYALRVPRFIDARHADRPLVSSSANPHKGDLKTNVIDKIQGQELHGDMIPIRESFQITREPQGGDFKTGNDLIKSEAFVATETAPKGYGTIEAAATEDSDY